MHLCLSVHNSRLKKPYYSHQTYLRAYKADHDHDQDDLNDQYNDDNHDDQYNQNNQEH